MRAKTMERPIPALRAAHSRAGRALAALAAALLLAAGPAAAQEPCDASAGTLGIRAMRCEGCTFSMSREGITEARFRTEPQVVAVWLGLPSGDRLHAGDRIVAIDGRLITTREGSQALVDLRTGQEVAIRVRRDSRIVDLEMVAASACELDRRLKRAEAEMQVLDPMPPGYDVDEMPPPPPADAPLPAPPAMPAMPAMPPSGYLGFGIKCGPCGVRNGVRFFDGNPPVVTNVVEGGPAGRAGLAPEDVILAIDGVDITTAEGGARFSGIEPGDRVELTIRRGDARRTVTLEAGDRPARGPVPAAAPAPPARPAPPAGNRIRFEGTVGDVGIQVRGAPVTVSRDEATGELVIRTSDTVIRLRPGG